MLFIHIKMTGRDRLLRTTTALLVFFLFLDSKIFEKLPNSRLINHIKKCGLFSKFQYGFKYSQPTTDPLPYFTFSR